MPLLAVFAGVGSSRRRRSGGTEPSPAAGCVAAAAALELLLGLARCGSNNGDLSAQAPETATPGAVPDKPTGGPADDENELTPPEKTPEEREIEEGPLPPPEAPPPAELRRLCFSPKEDCVTQLLRYLEAETQAIDMAIYHLYDHRISQLLVAKQQAGVRVRVLADRHAYTAKPQHAQEMNFLAANGVPVRTNRHRGILHHKLTILYGLGLVEHGSMNYTSVASRKITLDGVVTWNEEVAFFTTNPLVVARFKERFERMWNNTGDGQQTFQVFTAGMRLPTFEETEANKPLTCYENPSPDPKPLPDDPQLQICFAPDQNCNREVIAPIISRETRRLDIIMFRATSYDFATPLIEKVKAGLPVRLIFERSQYQNPAYPSMTQIIDDLRAANTAGNLQLKWTAHPGSMHMKNVITPEVATWSSGNFSRSSSRRVRGCQTLFYQDEDMVIARDPALVGAVQARFDEMWTSSDFADFTAASASAR